MRTVLYELVRCWQSSLLWHDLLLWCACVLYLESPMKAVVDLDIHQHIKYIEGILLLVLVAKWCLLATLEALLASCGCDCVVSTEKLIPMSTQ